MATQTTPAADPTEFKPLTMVELKQKYGDQGVLDLANATLKLRFQRLQYTQSPEAKQAAKDRRKKTAEEIKQFRAWKEQQVRDAMAKTAGAKK